MRVLQILSGQQFWSVHFKGKFYRRRFRSHEVKVYLVTGTWEQHVKGRNRAGREKENVVELSLKEGQKCIEKLVSRKDISSVIAYHKEHLTLSISLREKEESRKIKREDKGLASHSLKNWCSICLHPSFLPFLTLVLLPALFSSCQALQQGPCSSMG